MPSIEREEWQRLSTHLDRALDLSDPERERYLVDLQAEDPKLAGKVRRVLEARSEDRFQQFLAGEPLAGADALASATLIGRRVGPYVIDAELGRGGMGSVWRAHRADGRYEGVVAIKFVHVAWIGQSGEQRFRVEGSALGRLDHPNIARLLDAGVLDDTQPYLVLEYVEGEPIDAYCDRQHLGVDARIGLFLHVLAAVAHAHSHLVVHRDIKPTNVFVTADATVKLLDFGIAKLLDGASGSAALTKASAIPLTPEYAAPEQHLGLDVSTATDVYSLGLVLYALLTGSHPLTRRRESGVDSVGAAIANEVPQASTVTGGTAGRSRSLVGDLDNILAKALKKDPVERYQSVGAFADDLKRYLAHEPVQARPDTVAYRAGKFVRRHRGSVLAACLTALALVATTGFALWQTSEARTQRGFAYQQMARAEAINDLNAFLLSDVAPGGKPFTVDQLLQRAEHVVDKQRVDDAGRVGLLIAIGGQYLVEDEDGRALEVLGNAYRQSRQLHDPAVRAQASCAWGSAVSRSRDSRRAESLILEGLHELPDRPQFALDRVFCLLRGSLASRFNGDAQQAVERVLDAQRILDQSPFEVGVLKLRAFLDLAEAYREAGQLREAAGAFEQASLRLAALGRDDTETAGTLYNNWALALAQLGQPLVAERLYRRAMEISRVDGSDEGVSPMLLVNLARALDDLDRLDEAQHFAERAYAKAKQQNVEVEINQSLIERARISRQQHDLAQASALLDEVEPRLRKALPEGHYAFAALATERSLIAGQRGQTATALVLASQAVDIAEAAVRTGASSAGILPLLLDRRSAVELELGRSTDAERDADRALDLLKSSVDSGTWSRHLGRAFLARGQVLAAQGRSQESARDFHAARQHLEPTLGPNHPDSRQARQLDVASSASR